MIERIIVLECDSVNNALAWNALHLIKEGKPSEAVEYLAQWHYPGEHETSPNYLGGAYDHTYDQGGYRLTWSLPLGYVGLEFSNG